jgi:ubiquinone/menaquinone biosynthesis C-methylase UbiE
MDINSTKNRFSDRVDNYKKYRPNYPLEVISFIHKNCQVTPSWAIADVGSGTGISSRFLIEGFQCSVYAVEPNEKMRTDAENSSNGNSLFRSVNGSSDATTLADESVNMVTAFQAFHWFDRDKARKEFIRILKDPKYILFVWNDRKTTGSDFLEGYEAISQNLPEYQNVNHRNISIEDLCKFIGNKEIKTAQFSNAQKLDLEGLKGRFFSSSYTPAFGTEAYQKQIKNLEKLFLKTNENGRIEFKYVTEVYLGILT